ncbi:MAG: hypothetical protein G01um101448_596 [Parcubacteria group bacterium Gr01-1014_48]|nr:MAG: hypothetical protein Greene041614_1176 [Parcubacteria group bacterium Greene0416_14]TSC73707.1 MAG: hypothetical protein G01um101448_596 [Parcubacteria group bacterium Gr01-1014_48]TSC99245.1 MAG: hypothetical protein Greene101415_1177 [Parcubacteria group bacterium Greene1014_15]TSD06924.1 MAG: hypothetical protein Greene07144_1054 [Parcubacteria group bacterium Greene0714_4]
MFVNVSDTCYHGFIVINVEVDKTGNESNASVIRRFTKRVQGAGILTRVRRIRYKKREPSAFTKKKFVLKSISRRAIIDELVKMGKMPIDRREQKKWIKTNDKL